MAYSKNGTRRATRRGWKPKVFVIDVDGVMTTGHFFYSAEGKVFKVFGPDDHDALLLLRPYVDIRFVTGDRKGLSITRKRIELDMKMPLDLVSTVRRVEWIETEFGCANVVYMGDGIFDSPVFSAVTYSICPANGFYLTRSHASFVTRACGGERAVAEACIHLLNRFFSPFDPQRLPERFHSSGEWSL